MNTSYSYGQLWNSFKTQWASSKLSILKSGNLSINNKTMKFTYQTNGPKPPNGYALIFGLHGGGGCEQSANDQQYQNHKHLYDDCLPSGSIWFTPRSCQDDWDMWFKDYMEDFILEIIRSFLVNDLIDINKVFITGYSAGGDGVYHLAPRLADHLAGAAMMAGHPNGINLMNTRNIGFSIQVGSQDNSYNRKNEAIKYIRMHNQLKQNYGGFKHQSQIHSGKSHWMQKQDSQIFNWLFSLKRNPYPNTILFKQCPRRKKNTFYYLRIDEESVENNEQLLCMKDGNTFNLYTNRAVTVLVNRKMVDQSMPVTIIHNSKVTHNRMLAYRQDICQQTLFERIDPQYIFEDEFYSKPPLTISVQDTICQVFDISRTEKDAQFQKSLPNQLGQTPKNFNLNVQPAVQRTKAPKFNQDGQIIKIQIPQNFQGSLPNWGSNSQQNSSWNNQGIWLNQQSGWNNQPNQQSGWKNQPNQGGWNNQGSQQSGWNNQSNQGGWNNQPNQGGWDNQPNQQIGWNNQQSGWNNQSNQGGWNNQPNQQIVWNNQQSGWNNQSNQQSQDWGNQVQWNSQINKKFGSLSPWNWQDNSKRN